MLLFNKLYIIFIGAAFLLFIAMIGAIVLTMDNNERLLDKKRNEARFSSTNIN